MILGIILASAAFVSTVAGWAIESGKTDCVASSDFSDGTTIEIGHSFSGDNSTVILWNDKWQSIEDGKDYQISWQIDSGPKNSVTGSGMKVESAGGIFLSWDEIGIIPDIMRGSNLLLWNGASFIGKFDLAGSNAAMLAVARCVGRKSVETKPDPFAN